MRTAARRRFFRLYLQFYKIFPLPYANTAAAGRRGTNPRSCIKTRSECRSSMRSNRHTKPAEILQNKRWSGICPLHPIQSKKALRPTGRSPLYTINNFICIQGECQEIVTQLRQSAIDFTVGRGYYNNNFIPSKALKRTNGRIYVRASENAAPAIRPCAASGLPGRCLLPPRSVGVNPRRARPVTAGYEWRAL